MPKNNVGCIATPVIRFVCFISAVLMAYDILAMPK